MLTGLALPSQIETWTLDRLKPYARNSKTHGPEQVAKIAASMCEYGWTSPVLDDASGEVISGHGRMGGRRQPWVTRLRLHQVAGRQKGPIARGQAFTGDR